MRHIRTLSRTFPAYHPRKGEPTFFMEKFWASIGMNDDEIISQFIWPSDWFNQSHEPKHHTIRAGHHIKVGDTISFRVWSGKPYRSKQIIIAPDIEVKNVWKIGLRIRGDFKEFYSMDTDMTMTSINQLAINDGLHINDLFSWFNKPFEGQIICWNDQITY